MAFKLSLGTNVPKVCQKTLPHIITLPAAVYTKFGPSECRKKNRNSSDWSNVLQATLMSGYLSDCE